MEAYVREPDASPNEAVRATTAQVSVPLSADLTTVVAARWAVREFTGDQHGHSAAVLVTSELVTNALVHAGIPVRLALRSVNGGRDLLIEVTDAGPLEGEARPKALRHEHVAESTSGRGLLMVERLSSSWGVRPEGVGKTVWAIVGLPNP